MKDNSIIYGSNEEYSILFIAPFDVKKAVYASALLAKMSLIYPNSTITVVTSFFAASLFSCYPNRIVMKPEDTPFSPQYFLPLLVKKWNVVVNMENNRSFMLRFLRCEQYIDLTNLNYLENTVPIVGEKVGISNLSPEILLADEFIHGAEKRLYKKQHIIAVAPFTDSGKPVIPLNDMLFLLKRLTMAGSVFPSSPVAVLGFEGARKKITENILQELPPWQKINLVGSLGLLSITAILNKCRFFIGGDSVISHLAAVSNIASWVTGDIAGGVKVCGRYSFSFSDENLTVDKIVQQIDDIWHDRLQQ